MNSGTIAFTFTLEENALNKKSHKLFMVSFIFITLLLTACSSGKPGAVRAIEAYIQALSDKDEAQISNLSCSGWEADAIVELDSLAGVGSKVEGLNCSESGQSGADTYVSCTGKLALDYNGEAQQIDLSTRTYVARQEDGEWRMCGYH